MGEPRLLGLILLVGLKNCAAHRFAAVISLSWERDFRNAVVSRRSQLRRDTSCGKPSRWSCETVPGRCCRRARNCCWCGAGTPTSPIGINNSQTAMSSAFAPAPGGAYIPISLIPPSRIPTPEQTRTAPSGKPVLTAEFLVQCPRGDNSCDRCSCSNASRTGTNQIHAENAETWRTRSCADTIVSSGQRNRRTRPDTGSQADEPRRGPSSVARVFPPPVYPEA